MTPEAPTLGERHLRFWKVRLDEPSFVYVIRGRSKTPIKIGVAKDPMRRLASLQTGNPHKLRLLLVLPGGESLERELHGRFAGARLPGGEWFGGRQVGPMLSFLNRLSRRMVEGYKVSGRVPELHELEPWAEAPRRAMRRRFVEPSPRVRPDEAERLRESMRQFVPTITSRIRRRSLGPRVNPARERRAPLSQ